MIKDVIKNPSRIGMNPSAIVEGTDKESAIGLHLLRVFNEVGLTVSKHDDDMFLGGEVKAVILSSEKAHALGKALIELSGIDEEPAQKLEWKVGTKVLVKKSSISSPHFDSRLGYVGTIEVDEGDRLKVKFPEASFAAPIEPDNYSSWWFKSELELVPNDYDGGKEPMRLKLNDKWYIAGDGEHLTKDISKANMTEDYRKHLSDQLTASFAEIYEASKGF